MNEILLKNYHEPKSRIDLFRSAQSILLEAQTLDATDFDLRATNLREEVQQRGTFKQVSRVCSFRMASVNCLSRSQ